MEQKKQMIKMGWGRFLASAFIMFFHQVVYEADHSRGLSITAVMLGFMSSMYDGLATKIGVRTGAAVIGGAAGAADRGRGGGLSL